MIEKEPRIILASASPRRADLLNAIGVGFEAAPSRVLERPHPDEAPADYIMRLARAKVIEVARRRDSGLVIGVATTFVLDGRLIRASYAGRNAERIVKMLSGKWHAVMTGVSLYDAATKREVADYDKTLVKFAALTEKEIDWYVKTGEPMDKAGAYAIQGRGAMFIDEIAGNYHNVVGLPIPLVYRLAKRLGYNFIT